MPCRNIMPTFNDGITLKNSRRVEECSRRHVHEERYCGSSWIGSKVVKVEGRGSSGCKDWSHKSYDADRLDPSQRME